MVSAWLSSFRLLVREVCPWARHQRREATRIPGAHVKVASISAGTVEAALLAERQVLRVAVGKTPMTRCAVLSKKPRLHLTRYQVETHPSSNEPGSSIRL